MIVAWHEMPGSLAQAIPSRGYGLIRVGMVSIAGDPNYIEACRIKPSLWDGINQSADPRHFMPGYYRFVPPG